MIRDVQDYTSALDFDTNDPPLIPTPGGSLPGGARPQGSPLHMGLHLCQKRRLHPCMYRRNHKQPPRAPTATRCGPVLPALLLAANSVRLQLETIGPTGQPRRSGRYLLEGHASTGAQARISKTRISRQCGRCAPSRQHVQPRESLHHTTNTQEKLSAGGKR